MPRPGTYIRILKKNYQQKCWVLRFSREHDLRLFITTEILLLYDVIRCFQDVMVLSRELLERMQYGLSPRASNVGTKLFSIVLLYFTDILFCFRSEPSSKSLTQTSTWAPQASFIVGGHGPKTKELLEFLLLLCLLFLLFLLFSIWFNSSLK